MRLLSAAGVTFALIGLAQAIGQQSCVSFTSSRDSFSVVNNGRAAPIFVSADDWPGVHRATSDFVADIKRVTGATPALANVSFATTQRRLGGSPAEGVIIVGTLGKSELISQVVNATGLDVSSIQGKWESFMTRVVTNPIPGIPRAYVIIGSDKRGTIYGLYDHSEQFGVSPWYWCVSLSILTPLILIFVQRWADVPTPRRPSLFVSNSGCSHGPPTVQYRGIFLNDEQPALQSWAMEKFTNGTGSQYLNSPFNHFFYEHVCVSSLLHWCAGLLTLNRFELLLRLKANYLWPAMWGR
jgi:hypothetical protein